MNDEEKKAIDRIYVVTHCINGEHTEYIDIDNIANEKENLDNCEGFCEAIDIVLNLIEKQSKEIEELNKSDESKEQSSMKYYNLYKELVDKIKEEIEAIKTHKLRYFHIAPENWAINILQSLLEKCERKE